MTARLASAVLCVLFLGPLGQVAGQDAASHGADGPVQKALHHRGATVYNIEPIAEDYLAATFPDAAFFGVFFPQYPVGVVPPEGLAPSNVAVVADGQVVFLTGPGALEKFFGNHAPRLKATSALQNLGLSWMRLTEEFSQDGFFQFSEPTAVVMEDGTGAAVVMGTVEVTAGGKGYIVAELYFDANGQFTGVDEERNIHPGPRPI